MSSNAVLARLQACRPTAASRRLRFGLIQLVTALGLSDVRADDPMRVMVGDNRAVVTWAQQVAVTSLVQDVTLAALPPEADLGSLMVSTRAIISNVEWQGVAPQRLSSAAVIVSNSEVRWRVHALPSDLPPAATGLQCRLTFPDLGSREVAWTYLATGMSWRANYQVLVRGEFDNEQEPLSVDVDGAVIVSNGLSTSMGPCALTVVGSGRPKKNDASLPGFLIMNEADENPLIELLEPANEADDPGHLFRLPDEWTLPAHRETEITIFSTHRQPVSRLYRLEPEGGPGSAQALRKFIVFQNRERDEAGPALPAGRAHIFLGSLRNSLNQDASFGYTPANGEIRIDLGRTDRLRGLRSMVSRIPVEDGLVMEAFEVRVSSDLSQAVDLEIEERPPSSLEWEVLRSNRPWDRRGQSLLFRTTVDGHGEVVINYTIRLRQPQG